MIVLASWEMRMLLEETELVMTLFVGGVSAARFWQWDDSLGVGTGNCSEQMPLTWTGVDWAAYQRARMVLGPRVFADGLDVLVSKSSLRYRKSGFRCHVVSADLPTGSFVCVAKDVFVAAPELAFVQMGRHLPLASLIEYGMQLCGSYVFTTDNEKDFDYREPITNQKKLLSFVDKVGPIEGKTQAKRAVQYIIENSASPWESKTYELACLPPKIGGYHLYRPVLNWEIPRSDVLASDWFDSTYRADLAWPDDKLLIEYNGSYHYETPEQRRRDDYRRNVLGRQGWSVFVLDSTQVHSPDVFDETIKGLARILGKRLRNPTLDQLFARQELRQIVLSNGSVRV